MIKLKYFQYGLLSSALFLQACSDTEVNETPLTQTVQIPMALAASDLPGDGTFSLVIYNGGQVLASKALVPGEEEVSITLDLVEDEYNLAAVFEYSSSVYTDLAVASSPPMLVDLKGGSVVELSIDQESYLYNNDDNDLFSNLIELQEGTDPRLSNDFIFVAGDNGETGLELYLYLADGAEGSLGLVKDINILGDADPANLVEMNGEMFFTATDGVRGVELWRTNGLESGTSLVRDINEMPGLGSDPSQLTVFGDFLYFIADDGVFGKEIWVTSGSAEDTRVIDVNPGALSSAPSNVVVLNGVAYFIAKDARSGSNNTTLWKMDAPYVEWERVMDLTGRYKGLMIAGDTLYFIQLGGSEEGVNDDVLWSSDGSAESTAPLGVVGSYSAELTVVGDALYYVVPTIDSLIGPGREGGPWQLWKTDDSEFGASEVQILENRPFLFDAAGGKVTFMTGDLLWKVDGTSEGMDLNTRVGSTLKDVIQLTTGSYSSYFVFDNGELWMHDYAVTDPASYLLTDIGGGLLGTPPDNLVASGDVLYFIAGNGDSGRELWVSEGTLESTRQVMDLNIGEGSGVYSILSQ